MKVSDSAPTLPPTLALPPTEAFFGELVFRGEGRNTSSPKNACVGG